MLLHLPLGFKMRDAGPAVRAAHRCVHIMRHACFLGRIVQNNPLLCFRIHPRLERRGHREHILNTAQGRCQTGGVSQVTLDDFGASLGQSCSFVRVSGQDADLLPLPQQTARDCASLLSRHSCHQNHSRLSPGGPPSLWYRRGQFVSQMSTSAPVAASAVSRGAPVAVRRTASPVAREPAPSSSAAPLAT